MHEICNFVRIFLGYQFDWICLEVEKIFKQIMHFHYMTYMATPQPWGHIIYSFGRPFLDHRYYTLSLTELCPGEEKIFKEILQFYTSYSQNTPPPPLVGVGRGSWNLQFLVFLPYRCYIPFGKDWPSSSWEEDVNARRPPHDEQRRTPTHSNRSTDRSDSGDVKI